MTQPDELNSTTNAMTDNNYSNYESLQFESFDYTEYKSYDMQNDLDPENNFYTKVQNDCNYYTESQFEAHLFTKDSLSIIHFNSRSLNSNFSQILNCLRQTKNTFSVIAISETWLCEDQSSHYEIEGYNAFFQNRNFAKGGGVALYVDQNWTSKIVSNKCLALDHVMECVTVEVEVEKSKNVLISCVYRKPGSCIDTFQEKVIDLYEDINNRKMLFVCGDFNIDLLSFQEQSAVTEFIHSMYSLCLYPFNNKTNSNNTNKCNSD